MRGNRVGSHSWLGQMSIKAANAVQVPRVITGSDFPLRMPMLVQIPCIESLLIAPARVDAINSSSMLTQIIEVISRAARNVTRMATRRGINDVVGAHGAAPQLDRFCRAVSAESLECVRGGFENNSDAGSFWS